MTFRIAATLLSSRSSGGGRFFLPTIAAATVATFSSLTFLLDSNTNDLLSSFHKNTVSHCRCDSVTQTQQQQQQQQSSSSFYLSRNFVADAVENVLPAVVRVEVHVKASSSSSSSSSPPLENKNDDDDNPTDISYHYDQRGTGSGFFVLAKDILNTAHVEDDNDVLVVTNAHCVLTPQEFQDSVHNISSTKIVYLELADDRIITGTIIAFDTQRDVALIRPDTFVENMTAAHLLMYKHDDNMHKTQKIVRYGEFVAALGAPLELENTVTVGIVSNPYRRCRHDPGKTYIQTDNTCHVGNSGGPLVNMDGKVIGITAKKVADGIAYSIPIGDAIECLRVALYSNKQNVLDRAVVVARRITLDNSRIKEAHKDAPADEKSKSADSSHDGSSFLPHILPERVPVMISRRG